jgi:hypothetical protein
MMNKKSPRITRINANNSGAFRMGRIFPWLSVLSVAVRGCPWPLNVEEVLRRVQDERRSFVAFVSFDDNQKSHRITRINANKSGVFRAGRIFPWLSELSVAVRGT